MKTVAVTLAALVLANGSLAASKILDCKQMSTNGVTQVGRVTIDDASDKAEVMLYATTANCAASQSCPTRVFRKEVLPSVLILRSDLEPTGPTSYIRVVQIDRKTLAIETRAYVGSTTNQPTMTLSGTCRLIADESKKQL